MPQLGMQIIATKVNFHVALVRLASSAGEFVYVDFLTIVESRNVLKLINCHHAMHGGYIYIRLVGWGGRLFGG
jgi:hypothetical protein